MRRARGDRPQPQVNQLTTENLDNSLLLVHPNEPGTTAINMNEEDSDDINVNKCSDNTIANKDKPYFLSLVQISAGFLSEASLPGLSPCPCVSVLGGYLDQFYQAL